MKPLTNPMAATLLAALAGVACSRTAVPETAPQPDVETMELEALYNSRMDAARIRFTEADVHFITGMIGHHAQALVMAGLAPTHGASPPVQTLCARIINAQRDEIALMQHWLRDRGQPAPEVEITGTALKVSGPDYVTQMPGMLTPERIEELNDARGQDFDRAFLTYMIQHHQGAVSMVHSLFGTDGAAQGDLVFKLASDIQVDQITEIARMNLMLEALPAPDGVQ